MTTINREFTFELTAKELADSFSDMYSEEQVDFFNALAYNVSQWKGPFCIQLQYITDSTRLTKEARRLMEQIGEYAQPYRALELETDV